MDRREFLKTSATLTAGLAGSGQVPKPARQRPMNGARPFIHTTDLYRPHDDPDDHWDLASIFALDRLGHLDLKAVILDFPRDDRRGDPDLMAVAQMDYITGRTTPIVIAPSQQPLQNLQEGALAGNQSAAVEKLLHILRESEEPVAIHIGGSSRAVALASKLAPDLFKAKCAGIYLNAGYGTQHHLDHTDLEPNVHADPASFSQLFKVSCPLFWFPCFEINWQAFGRTEWGTYYHFEQKSMLPELVEIVQQFFALVYRDGTELAQATRMISPNWLRDLLAPRDTILASQMGYIGGNMWSTAGILSAAGMTVTAEGKLLKQATETDSVFELLPIDVTCSPDGITTWTKDPLAKNRFIFHARDQKRYEPAMAAALKMLLSQLGRV